MPLALVLVFALSRAEIIARMRAPVITQAEGMVQVFAGCPEDMRREYQSPIASFAADTVGRLNAAARRRPGRFSSPAIIVHVGDVRTNDATVVATVSSNATRVVTRIYLKAPGFSDLDRFRLETVKAYCRAVEGTEIGDAEARRRYRATDPALRLADRREAFENWFRRGLGDFDAGVRELHTIVEPGRATRTEVLIFASRLRLYAPFFGYRLLGKYDSLTFREALKLGGKDPLLRLLAFDKAPQIEVYGGGRGDNLYAAALAYAKFLRLFAAGESERAELEKLLDDGEMFLNLALEQASSRRL